MPKNAPPPPPPPPKKKQKQTKSKIPYGALMTNNMSIFFGRVLKPIVDGEEAFVSH